MSVKIKDNSGAVKAAMERAIKQALYMMGDEAHKRATKPVAEGGNMPVDTGNLRTSINYVVDGHSMIIGSNVEYALYQELGTSKNKAHKFLTKALTEDTDEYRKILEFCLEQNGF